MPRYVKDALILARTEVTAGTDAAPTGAADAIVMSNQSVNILNARNADRGIRRSWFGAEAQLVGTSHKEISFDVELVGSGTAGTAPPWGRLVRACAFAEVVTAGVRVDYLPVSSDGDSLTIYYFDGGIVHKLTGCRGNVSFDLRVGEIPRMRFAFQGLDGGDVAALTPAGVYSGFQVPEVVTDPNTGNLIFGGTVAATGAPAITGGTDFVSQGLEVDMGNMVSYVPLLGAQSVGISDRMTKGKLTLELSGAAEQTMITDVRANTLRSVALAHGTRVGHRVLVSMPSVQLTNPTKAEVDGRRMLGLDLIAIPVTGNDEFRLVTSY